MTGIPKEGAVVAVRMAAVAKSSWGLMVLRPVPDTPL